MELVDRYLYAVGKYLPKDRRDDILAELRANIMSLVDDREEELGRSLNIDEEEAVLKQHGHPMLVAARYLPQQHLIGPAVFPFYWHTMKIAFPWIALIYLVANAARFINEPFTAQRVVEIVFQFVPVAFYSAAWITLAFAAMEFCTAKYMKNSRVLYAWSPRKLPPVEIEAAGERKCHPIFDFIGSVFTLVFLFLVRRHPFIVLGPGSFYLNTFKPAPVWDVVYLLALIFVGAQLIVKFAAIFSPAVRSLRAYIDLVTKIVAIAIVGYLVHAHEFVVLAAGIDPARHAKTVETINSSALLGFRILMIVMTLELFWTIGKIVLPRLHLRSISSQFFS